MLPTIALAAGSRPSAERFTLPDIPCRTTVVLTPDGRQHLLFTEVAHALQLSVTGASLSEPVRLLTDAALPPQHVRARLLALECLTSINGRGRFPNRPRVEPRGRCLRVVLQALDGWLAGAPYREIAKVDVGFGDVTEPGVEMLDYPVLIEVFPRMRSSSPVTASSLAMTALVRRPCVKHSSIGARYLVGSTDM